MNAFCKLFQKLFKEFNALLLFFNLNSHLFFKKRNYKSTKIVIINISKYNKFEISFSDKIDTGH